VHRRTGSETRFVCWTITGQSRRSALPHIARVAFWTDPTQRKSQIQAVARGALCQAVAGPAFIERSSKLREPEGSRATRCGPHNKSSGPANRSCRPIGSRLASPEGAEEHSSPGHPWQASSPRPGGPNGATRACHLTAQQIERPSTSSCYSTRRPLLDTTAAASLRRFGAS
jgi:hypothetical protein